jgi:Zn-dependent protease with chaperone function
MTFTEKILGWPYLPALLLALPTVCTIAACAVAFSAREAYERRNRWRAYRQWGTPMELFVLIVWWRWWDWSGGLRVALPRPTNGPLILSGGDATSFWWMPVAAMFFYLFLSAIIGTLVYRVKRGIGTCIFLAVARIGSLTVPVLALAVGYDYLMDRKWYGFLLVVLAGIASRIGYVLMLDAVQFRMNVLRSGDTLSRARMIAHQMDVQLKAVFMTPAGRDNLTNAYSLGDSIGITDSLGKHLNRGERDFAIAHEVAHCKRRHGIKHLKLAIAIFGAAAILLFAIGPHAAAARTLLAVSGILVPVAADAYISRRYEFEADATAFEFTGNADSAIRALAGLARATRTRERPSLIPGIFASHPSVLARAQALARKSRMPDAELKDILRELEIIETTN